MQTSPVTITEIHHALNFRLQINEQKIHPTQKIEVLSGDLFKITFSVHDSLEVTRLLAQYGEFIRKIEPTAEYDKVKLIWQKGLKAS